MDNNLWREYQKTRSSEIRNQILLKYIHLVKIIVLRMVQSSGRSNEIEDMISYGTLGLIDAIEKYDLSKKVKFETYASYRIRGAIIDQWRKQDWVPRNVRARAKNIMDEYDKLETKLGRQPSDEEVAQSLEIPLSVLRQTMDEAYTFNIISLDELIYETFTINNHVSSGNYSEPENSVVQKELIKELTKLIDELSEKERLVVALYYYEELTLKEIGEVMGVTESRVCQIHSKCITKIRNSMQKKGLLPA